MFKDRFIILSILMAIIFIQLMMWVIFLNRQVLPPQVPLFYFRPWGEGQLAPSHQFWFIPAFTGGIFVINVMLARYLYRQDKILAQLLVFGAAVIAVVATLFLFRIIWLVIP